jgi:hypothetical protein
MTSLQQSHQPPRYYCLCCCCQHYNKYHDYNNTVAQIQSVCTCPPKRGPGLSRLICQHQVDCRQPSDTSLAQRYSQLAADSAAHKITLQGPGGCATLHTISLHSTLDPSTINHSHMASCWLLFNKSVGRPSRLMIPAAVISCRQATTLRHLTTLLG